MEGTETIPRELAVENEELNEQLLAVGMGEEASHRQGVQYQLLQFTGLGTREVDQPETLANGIPIPHPSFDRLQSIHAAAEGLSLLRHLGHQEHAHVRCVIVATGDFLRPALLKDAAVSVLDVLCQTEKELVDNRQNAIHRRAP